MPQGVVKTYDSRTGIGLVVRDDDRSDVLLGPGSLDGSIFRMLRQGQRIVFDVADRDGRPVATNIRVGQDVY